MRKRAALLGTKIQLEDGTSQARLP